MAKPAHKRTVGNPIIAVIDVASLILGGNALHYLFTKVKLPAHLAAAGQFQFLTNLSLLISLIIFALGAVAHLTRSVPLYNFKNTIHPIGMVLEAVVTTVYWPLRLFFLGHLIKDPKRELVPIPIDLCLHLLPAASLLIDYLVFMPRWTLPAGGALSAVVALTSIYWAWLKFLIDFENGGEYPYEFLNGDDETKRAIIFTIVALTGFVFFLIIKKAYDVLVGAEEDVEKQD